MSLLTMLLTLTTVHATPSECTRSLLETLTEIEAAWSADDPETALHAQQNFLLPRFVKELPEFEVDLVNAAPQGYLPVHAKHSFWAHSEVGHLRRGDGILMGRHEMTFQSASPLVLPGQHRARLTPFGVEFVKFNRDRGVRVSVLTWQPGVGRFRARANGMWYVLNDDAIDEPVALVARDGAAVIPTADVEGSIILLEWSERSFVKRSVESRGKPRVASR